MQTVQPWQKPMTRSVYSNPAHALPTSSTTSLLQEMLAGLYTMAKVNDTICALLSCTCLTYLPDLIHGLLHLLLYRRKCWQACTAQGGKCRKCTSPSWLLLGLARSQSCCHGAQWCVAFLFVSPGWQLQEVYKPIVLLLGLVSHSRSCRHGA